MTQDTVALAEEIAMTLTDSQLSWLVGYLTRTAPQKVIEGVKALMEYEVA